MRESIGLYLLGALPADEGSAVESHLASCETCCAEADELATASSALALLSEQDVREVIAEFEPPARQPSASQPSASQPSASQPSASTGARPAATRPGGGRRWLRRRRTRALLVIVALTVVSAVSGVAALGLALGRSDTNSSTDITLAATASAADGASGASLSVLVFGDQQGATIRATVAGLQEGEHYQLFVVASDGRTRVACQWSGSRGVQDVSGPVALPVPVLSFFTITKLDGTTVVSAYLPRSAPFRQ